eukprot:TRINITY_DN411_c0_g1_i2.p1 TRINITY_DN411_c0_g1~~TRINITY_DN411_c0_g1_i2.p1  ORF type:complete len:127 (-),score=30.70 TRINITY_DN411_c0_g1_i2:263-643(-)
MAGGLCLGALMCILAGAVYNAWICLVSLVMYLLAPIPLLVCKSSSEDSNDVFHDMSGGGGGIGDLGEFLASTFGAVGLGLPLILYHVEVVPVAGALLAFFGGILIFAVIAFDFWLERRESEPEQGF